MTYYGSQMVVENHDMMEGPLATRAASGIREFDERLAKAQSKTPTRKPRQHR